MKSSKIRLGFRKKRIRSKVEGTTERPRLNIKCGHKHIYAQVIDDSKGFTLAAASTLSAEIKGTLKSTDTYYFNKAGILYSKNSITVAVMDDDYSYKIYKKAAEDGLKEKTYDTGDFDDENRTFTVEYTLTEDPKTYSAKEKKDLYVTNYVDDEFTAGYTCEYHGITEKEIKNAKK